MSSSRPNVLVIMTDEERYPPSYETEAIKQFRRSQLPGQQAIRARSTELHRHYAASTACAPSRASLFTGHYPTLHGVRATDGAAKGPRDADMFWLEDYTVPTLGHYFREAGYRTYFRGKWHVSHADLLAPDTGAAIASNDDNGILLEAQQRAYRAANRLLPFGFDGWIGPEPHGILRSNCGLVRDPIASQQIDTLFSELEASDDDKPWLMVASFLNPHDIVLFGALWLSWRYAFDDETVPDVPEPPTQDESLRTKPSCQAEYVKKYGKVFLPQPQIPVYRRFYYYLHKLADRCVQRTYERLNKSRFASNTIVVYTSDHGDMLGAHGGMHQKWHNAYDESIRVPMLVSGPGIAAGVNVDTPTNHVDVIPTLLGLAGIDAVSTREKLAARFTEAQPLVGRDLSSMIKGGQTEDEPVYFMTEDQVSEGLDQNTLLGFKYESIPQPAKVEAVIARLDGGLWKYARAYEHAQVGDPDKIESRREDTEVELYDLNSDPTETDNLAHQGILGRQRGPHELRERLDALLIAERKKKALHPKVR